MSCKVAALIFTWKYPGRWNALTRSLVQLWCGVRLELVRISTRDPLSGQEKWRRLAGGRFGFIALYLYIAAIYNQISYLVYFYAIHRKYLGDILCLFSVKMTYRALGVEGRVLSCQAKPSDNKQLQKKYAMVLYIMYIFCLCMQIFRVNFYEPLRFFNFWIDDFIMAIARFFVYVGV